MGTTTTLTAHVAKTYDWLSALREQGLEKLATLRWPGPKTEHWLHTPISKALAELPELSAELNSETVAALGQIGGLDAIRLVFVDGRFQSDLSTGLSVYAGQLSILSQLETSAQEQLEHRLNTTFERALNKDQHIGAWQNLSLLSDGLVIRVAADSQIDKPIHVVLVATPNSCSEQQATRIVCDLERGAKACLIEHQVVLPGGQGSFSNQLTEIELEEGAVLDHYRLGLEGQSAVSLAAAHCALCAHARYQGFTLALGGRCQRHDLVVHHLHGGSHCELKGLYLPCDSEHVDVHSCIEHRLPNCTSNEVFRGIMAGKSTAVFNGRIHIHQDAQKTLAELSNRNLLLSPDAEVYTKPELEIYADDVRCAHGATVAQIDELALYYMQSRGISRIDAELMLSFGFINELVEQIELEPLAQFLKPVLQSLFTRAAAAQENPS